MLVVVVIFAHNVQGKQSARRAKFKKRKVQGRCILLKNNDNEVSKKVNRIKSKIA